MSPKEKKRSSSQDDLTRAVYRALARMEEGAPAFARDAPLTLQLAIEKAPLVDPQLLGTTKPLNKNAISRREKQVLILVAYGMTLPEVGSYLCLAHGTVQEHLKRIRRKLGARNTTHAVAIAVYQKMISLA